MKLKKLVTACAATAVAVGLSAAQADGVDPNLPDYERVSGISGNLSSEGSDTLNNLMTLWAEEFNEFYPNVNIQVQGAGSSTAPPALTEGTADFGPMSREMRTSELRSFEERHGYEPTKVPVAIDVLAVYVNKDNPIRGLTLQQVDAIFSSTRRGGHSTDIRTWGDAGLEGAWATRPISLYGRNAASGTYGFFKDHALFGGDFRDAVKEQPGSASVVQGVASELAGIGYSGIGYRTADVRAVPLARDAGSPFFDANAENAYNGNYPLARFLYVYVNAKPGEPLDPLRREFIRYIFSRQGQEDVIRDGYYPVDATVAREMLKNLGIPTDF